MSEPSHGYIITQSYAGVGKIPVEIVGGTPKRYRVKLLADCRLPGRSRPGKTGDVVMVPKTAVQIETGEPNQWRYELVMEDGDAK